MAIRWSVSLALVLVVPVLAGCFGAGKPDYPAIREDILVSAPGALTRDHGSDTGHFDAALHQGSHNLDQVAYHNGFDDSGNASAIPASGYYTEFAVTGNYAYVARQSTDGAFGGFSIIALNKDRKGVPAPHLVGSYPALGGADIEVDADETLAFFATQRSSIPQIVGAAGEYQDPAPTAPRGIHVVDIADKTNPTLAQFVPMPNNGPHTLTYYRSNATDLQGNPMEYVIACTYDLAGSSLGYVPGVPALPIPGNVLPATQRVQVFQLVRAPSASLVPIAVWEITDRPSDDTKMFFPHDTSVQVHPLTGDPVLYVAYWDQGVHLLDFSDPTRIADPASQLDFWTEFAPSSLTSIHYTRPFDELIDGLHVTVAEPEIIVAPDEMGQITFLDTTDPTDIKRLGHWTLGDIANPGIQDLDFSPHNFDLFDGKVVLGHNHAGVWVIDVQDADNLRDPKTVAYAMPAEPRADSPVPQPRVWGAFEQDGLIYVSDEASGLYVYEYTGP